MTDHGLRLRRLSAPNPVSRITAPPSNNHGPRPAAGGGVGGPVEASTVPAEGETDGASACSEGDGMPVDGLATDGAAVATLLAGGEVGRDVGVAMVGCAAGHTWLNETVGGCVPVPTP
jgi:hypothetical protein